MLEYLAGRFITGGVPQAVISNDILTVYLDRKGWDWAGPITDQDVCRDSVRDSE